MRKQARTPAASSGFWKGTPPGEASPGSSVLAVAFVSVSIVKVDVAVPALPGVTLAGEKLQTVLLGRELHARLVAALKPFTDVIVMVTDAGLPALKEPLPGDRANVKSGGPGQIVTERVLDAEAALLLSPP